MKTRPIQAADLRDSLEKSGSGWLLGYWGAEATTRLTQLASELDEFVAEYERRFGEAISPVELLRANPDQGRAFFQPDTLASSLEMKLMVYRILMGLEIVALEFHHEREGNTSLTVTLENPFDDPKRVEVYHGQGFDFRVLRRFGAVEINGRFQLQGYYAPRTL